MANTAELLGRRMKVGKIIAYLEPLLHSDPPIPISIVADMTSEWWQEVAKQAGCGHRKPPSQQTRDEVVRNLWRRALNKNGK
jgi:hypothetical protein